MATIQVRDDPEQTYPSRPIGAAPAGPTLRPVDPDVLRRAGAIARGEMTGSLARAAWEVRHILTFYDALYAALATGLGVPLLTADAALSRTPGLPCRVELVAPE